MLRWSLDVGMDLDAICVQLRATQRISQKLPLPKLGLKVVCIRWYTVHSCTKNSLKSWPEWDTIQLNLAISSLKIRLLMFFFRWFFWFPWPPSLSPWVQADLVPLRCGVGLEGQPLAACHEGKWRLLGATTWRFLTGESTLLNVEVPLLD